jgi:hypothetical protein
LVALAVKIILYAPQCHSLKEKRMILRSIISKVKNKFNVSIAEVDFQDVHQTIVLGVAVVSESRTHSQNVLDEVMRFVENNTEADVISTEFE